MVKIINRKYQLWESIKKTHETRMSEEKARRVKGEFISNMSHDFRTPLNHIIGFTEMLADGKVGFVNNEQKEHLDDVLTSSRYLLSLINDILELSKLDSGRINLAFTEINTQALLQEVVEIVFDKVAVAGIAINIELINPPITFYGDKYRITQAVSYLLLNTIKNAASSKIRVQATSSHEDGGDVCIRIVDTGMENKNTDLDRMFVPSGQMQSNWNWQAAGIDLDLSISIKIIDLHNGRFWAENNTKEKGVSFSLCIPVNQLP